MSSLKRILCKKIPEPHRPVELEETEATHATRVLRLTDGELVEAMDGKGHSAIAKLRTRSGPPRLEFHEKGAKATDQGEQTVPVILEMAVLKGEAMEWVVEKAVELGIKTLVPLLTAHTIVQMDRKGPEAFRERWQKIADQSLKQCGRLASLEVKIPIPFTELLTQKTTGMRILCDEMEREKATPLLQLLGESRAKNLSPIHLMIGPEGGWSQNEREILSREAAGAEGKLATASLGPLILRAETAAIAAMSLASFVDRNTQKWDV